MSRPGSRRWHLLGFLLGVAALVWLASRAGWARALDTIRAGGLPLVLLLVPYLVATALYAVPWRLVLPAAIRPRWTATVATRFAAAAVNVVLPSGFFGEPVRLRCVPTSARASAGEGLVWDRALYLVASGLFVGLCAVVGRNPGGAPFVAAALAALAGYVVGGASLVGITQLGPLRRWFGERLVRRWPRLERPPPALRPGAPRIALAIVVHLLARIAMGAEVWLGAKLLGEPLSLSQWAFAAGALALSAAAVPVVPGQIGIAEAALTGAFAAMGLPVSTGLALGLLLRLRQLVFVPVGFALAGSRATATLPEPASPPDGFSGPRPAPES